MRTTLVALAATLVAAGGANAATLTLELDQPGYEVGEDIIMTATLVADGTEVVQSFTGYQLLVNWDPSVASVDNAGVLFPDGHGTQLVSAGPGAGGSALTTAQGDMQTAPAETECEAAGACLFLLQLNDTLQSVELDAQTLVATLILRADSPGLLGEAIEAVQVGDVQDPGVVTLGANWGSAVVPEPGTGLLLGLGLLTLGARRRHGR